MAYDRKPQSYFEGRRADYVAELPRAPEARILEVGCARGGTGALALAEGKCGHYAGIELDPASAEAARAHLSEVHVGNVETMELPFEPGRFDALIVSEVLEHLVDPWAAVARLAPLVRPGGLVFASSPNVSHYSVIANLIRGRWELTDRGTMDRTHLRWFTPDLYAGIFRQAGFEIEQIRPVTPFAPRTRALDRLTGGRLRHLFMRQISIRARRL